MKLDKIKFARLISYICSLKDGALTQEAILTIDDLIDINVQPVETDKVPCDMVDELLKQIISPNGFIPAIKAYRSLTGAGLKEAKEAVEQYRLIPKFRHPPVNFNKFEG